MSNGNYEGTRYFWEKLTPNAKALLAENVCRVMGKDMTYSQAEVVSKRAMDSEYSGPVISVLIELVIGKAQECVDQLVELADYTQQDQELDPTITGAIAELLSMDLPEFIKSYHDNVMPHEFNDVTAN